MEDNNHKTQFHAVLADSASIDADALTALVAKYPYAQSLRVAQALQDLQVAGGAGETNLPLLYVGQPHRLFGLLENAMTDKLADSGDDDDIWMVGDSAEANAWPGESPTDAVDEASGLPQAEEAPRGQPVFRIDDPEAEAADRILENEGEHEPEGVTAPADGAPQAGGTGTFAIETVVPHSHDDEKLEANEAAPELTAGLETDADHGLAADAERSRHAPQEQAEAMDYLAYEETPPQPEETAEETTEEAVTEMSEETADQQANAEELEEAAAEAPVPQGMSTEPTAEDQQIVPASQARPHEKVSVYDDEHLPYSFLWWLNKARMDHADTYQPYVRAAHDTVGQGPASTRQPADQTLLDQQIRENIFHLQPPEEKLTVGNDAQTVSFKVPKKTDPIIERFIREEPQIKPPNPDKLTLKNMAKHSAEDVQEIVTETLAKIYADQGHYNKAIEAYKKLSLKYPEKSSYFADRISELEKKFI